MPFTDVKICNIALTSISDKSISDLSDGTRRADVCSLNYQPAVDEVLEMYDWTFASFFAELTLIDETPEFGYAYKYELPSSPYFLKLRETYPEVEYKIHGREIHCNSEVLKIRYTGRVEDESVFPSSFARACAYYLAYVIAWPITMNEKRQDKALRDFGVAFTRARIVDAEQKYDFESADESELWVNSRDI